MADDPKGRVAAGVLAAHVVCCGGLVLVATGALSGFGAWLLGDGLAWLAVAAGAVAAAGYVAWRRRGRAACATATLDAPPPAASER